ncbi:hypothetical protein ACED96_11855 [Clostridium thermobutyricum]|uniref:hypothetical protein n=1 Tax=Clostridium thermobutyricum TaxID=29372 RepID=UPI0029428FFA|nr:hypothetical protein [Clostridium thermobutyricum]
MNKEKVDIKSIIKLVISAILFLILGFIISKVSDYNLNNVFFVEGIILIFGGILSSMKGNTKGLSMQGLGRIDAQYISNINLEITKREREKVNLKEEMKFVFSDLVLILSGLTCIVVNYLI